MDACARRQAPRDADTTARPFPVTETRRERASSPGLIVIHAADSISARLRDKVVRSMLSLSANSPIVSGPARINITKIENWVTRSPCGRSCRSNARVILRAACREAKHRQSGQSERSVANLHLCVRRIQIYVYIHISSSQPETKLFVDVRKAGPHRPRRTTANGVNSFRPRRPQPGIRRLELAAAKLLHGGNQRAGGVAYFLLKCCVVVEIIVASRVGPHISNIGAEL